MTPTLELDRRQRAMLEAMGVPVWLPEPPLAEDRPVAAAVEKPAVARATALAASPALPPAARPTARAAVGTHAPHRMLTEPRLLFDQIDPAAAPAGLGAGWLIVAEPAPAPVPTGGGAGADPFAGDAGRLLSNMLRAMRLHRHPRVYLTTLVPAGAMPPDGDGMPGSDDGALTLAQRLDAVIAVTQPSMVLVMGRVAAQALLQTGEPLGRLRGRVLRLPGVRADVPALVTYDAPYLLRASSDKARAWADLCLALHAVRTQGGADGS